MRSIQLVVNFCLMLCIIAVILTPVRDVAQTPDERRSADDHVPVAADCIDGTGDGYVNVPACPD
jgi:hypothetical protein